MLWAKTSLTQHPADSLLCTVLAPERNSLLADFHQIWTQQKAPAETSVTRLSHTQQQVTQSHTLAPVNLNQRDIIFFFKEDYRDVNLVFLMTIFVENKIYIKQWMMIVIKNLGVTVPHNLLLYLPNDEFEHDLEKNGTASVSFPVCEKAAEKCFSDLSTVETLFLKAKKISWYCSRGLNCFDYNIT